MSMMTPLSLYIHIPFCHLRCSYCAFNTYTESEHLIEAYTDALLIEIDHLQAVHGAALHTIYFGGGTPSLMPPAEIARILVHIQARFDVSSQAEITLEANPGTIDLAYFAALRQAGVNRLSMGMQSAHDSELEMFGRLHRAEAVKQALSDARRAGFDNISLDLIYGNPHQTQEMWRETLQAALALVPDHFSIYALILEAGTELTRRVKYGLLPSPDDDLVADMYDDATDIMADAGYPQYELSSWGRASRHNVQYWRNLPYIGLGAGAHGYINQHRTVNAMRPEIYIARLKESSVLTPAKFPATPATIKAEFIDPETDMAETLFMGLRLLEEGLSLDAFFARHGVDLTQRYEQEIAELVAQGLLTVKDRVLRLSTKARLISNVVFRRFLQDA